MAVILKVRQSSLSHALKDVSLTSFTLRRVSQGTEKAPYFPRPLISDLDINMPLLNMANSAGQLEEK